MGGEGIRSLFLAGSEIRDNAVRCCGSVGIWIADESTGNVVTGNTSAQCGLYGILLSFTCTGNQVYGNQLVENWTNAFEDHGATGNVWYGPEGGNYWSDFDENPGYPDYYEIPGDGDGVDWSPLESVFTCPFTPGDVNGSCGPVDFADFTTFVDCWEISPEDCGAYGCADVDGDGDVNLRDFAAFSLLLGGSP